MVIWLPDHARATGNCADGSGPSMATQGVSKGRLAEVRCLARSSPSQFALHAHRGDWKRKLTAISKLAPLLSTAQPLACFQVRLVFC